MEDELPLIDGTNTQRMLPPAPEEPEEPKSAPEVAQETPAAAPQPAPAQSMADRYRQTSKEIAAMQAKAKTGGYWKVEHADLNIEERIRRATPVAAVRLPPVPSSIYLGGDGGRCRCPAQGCKYEGFLSNRRGYEEHWRAAHEKPTVS
jgi:hypothetical protein